MAPPAQLYRRIDNLRDRRALARAQGLRFGERWKRACQKSKEREARRCARGFLRSLPQSGRPAPPHRTQQQQQQHQRRWLRPRRRRFRRQSVLLSPVAPAEWRAASKRSRFGSRHGAVAGYAPSSAPATGVRRCGVCGARARPRVDYDAGTCQRIPAGRRDTR
ncbi:hypothetical protein MTO96_036288 [Rhipicephalus appendiculatus]